MAALPVAEYEAAQVGQCWLDHEDTTICAEKGMEQKFVRDV